MSSIETLVGSMDTDQQRRFLIYQKQKNKRSDTHNMKLFRYLAAGMTKKQAASKIYPAKNSNAFNILTKRLYDSLINFIAFEGFKNDASNEMDLLKLLLTARILLKQQHYKTAFKLLRKVTHKAESLELYSLAVEAGHTHIEYLHKDSSVKKNDVIINTRSNLVKLQQAEKLNISFAGFRQSIATIERTSEIKNLNTILETFFGIESGLQDSFTYKTLFQLMDISNEYASLYQEYHSIAPFMEKVYGLIAKKESLSDYNLYYHIQVVYLMANLYFRNQNFSTSQIWLDKMEILMKNRLHRYENRFLLKYTLLKSLNLHYVGKTHNAIALSETNLSIVRKPEITDKYNLLLALAMYYFYLEDLKKTASILKLWNSSDSTYEKKLGIDWITKKKLFEIIFHIEMENHELALSRIKSFKRKYKPYLTSLHNAFIFLKLIEMHLKNPENTSSQKFIEYANSKIIWQKQDQEDIFVISFYAWLKSKMTRTTLALALSNLIKPL